MKIETKKGYVQISCEEDENIIEMIEVYPEYRGQGVAQKLLKRAIKWHNNHKYNKPLTLCAYAQEKTIDTDRLVAWYENNGFSVTDTYTDEQTGRCVLMEY